VTLRKLNPGGEPPAYSKGILVPAGKTLYVAGQVGADASGACSSDVAAQCRQAWANIAAIVTDAGMEMRHIVKTTVFLVDRADYAAFAEARKNVLQDHKPASTLVYVSGLVKPEWKVEVEAVAVKWD
jgi:2-iminobutanoate/2-iminopropanoate deaminase